MYDSLTLFERNYPTLKEYNILKFYNSAKKDTKLSRTTSTLKYQPLRQCPSVVNETIRLTSLKTKIDGFLSDFNETLNTTRKGLFYIDYKAEGRDWSSFCLSLNQTYRQYRKNVADSLNSFVPTFIKNFNVILKELIETNIKNGLAGLDQIFESGFSDILTQSRFEVDKLKLDQLLEPLFETLNFTMKPENIIESATKEINKVEEYIREQKELMETNIKLIQQKTETIKAKFTSQSLYIEPLTLPKRTTLSKGKFYHSNNFTTNLFTFTEHISNELITDFCVWNELIISVSGDKSIRITDPCTNLEHACLSRAHEGIISCLTYLPGDIIATGGKEGLIQLFAIKNFRKMDTIHIHRDWIRQLLSYSVNTLISCSDDSSVVFYDYHLKQVVERINTPDHSAVTRMIITSNRAYLYFGGSNLYKYCLKAKRIIRTIETIHSGKYIRALAMYDDNIILSGGENGSIRAYDIVSDENLFNIFVREEIYSFCVFETKFLVVSTDKNKLVIINLEEQRKVEEINIDVFSYKLMEVNGGILFSKYNQILMLKVA